MAKESNSLPRMALYLGYGGLLPFLGLAIAGLVGYKSQALLGISVEAWMAIYAAVILSFLGAIHWGVVIALCNKLNAHESNNLLIYSIVPALLAWFSFLLPLKLTLFFLALMVLLTYFFDSLFLFKKLGSEVSPELSRGFAKLRLHLSITVSLLLLITGINLA